MTPAKMFMNSRPPSVVMDATTCESGAEIGVLGGRPGVIPGV